MHIELFRDDNIPITLNLTSAGKNQDVLLKGSVLRSHQSAFSSFFIQEYETEACFVNYVYVHSHMDHELYFNERRDGVRLMGVMKQAIKLQEKNAISIKPGQFILLEGRGQTIRLFLEKNKEYGVFSCYYNQDILTRLGFEPGSLGHKVKPRAFTPEMSAAILQMSAAYWKLSQLKYVDSRFVYKGVNR